MVALITSFWGVIEKTLIVQLNANIQCCSLLRLREFRLCWLLARLHGMLLRICAFLMHFSRCSSVFIAGYTVLFKFWKFISHLPFIWNRNWWSMKAHCCHRPTLPLPQFIQVLIRLAGPIPPWNSPPLF